MKSNFYLSTIRKFSFFENFRNPVFLICFLAFFLNSKSYATDYIFTGNGNWSNAALWSPAHPNTMQFDLAHTISISAGSVVNIDSWVNIQNNFTNNGTINVLAGQKLNIILNIGDNTAKMINNGPINVLATASFNVQKPLINNKGKLISIKGEFLSLYALGCTIENYGSFLAVEGSTVKFENKWQNFSGSAVNNYTSNFIAETKAQLFIIDAGSTFYNYPTGTLRASYCKFENSGTFISNGILDISNGTFSNKTGSKFIHKGTIKSFYILNEGTLDIQSAEFNARNIDNTNGGIIKGSFVEGIGGIVSKNGSKMMPGGSSIGIIKLTTGSFSQYKDAIWEMQIAGPDGPGKSTGHDQLVVEKGSALFGSGGTDKSYFNISLINNYIPAPGTTFRLVESVGMSANLSINFNYPTLPNGRTWKVKFIQNPQLTRDIAIDITAN